MKTRSINLDAVQKLRDRERQLNDSPQFAEGSAETQARQLGEIASRAEQCRQFLDEAQQDLRRFDQALEDYLSDPDEQSLWNRAVGALSRSRTQFHEAMDAVIRAGFVRRNRGRFRRDARALLLDPATQAMNQLLDEHPELEAVPPDSRG